MAVDLARFSRPHLDLKIIRSSVISASWNILPGVRLEVSNYSKLVYKPFTGRIQPTYIGVNYPFTSSTSRTSQGFWSSPLRLNTKNTNLAQFSGPKWSDKKHNGFGGSLGFKICWPFHNTDWFIMTLIMDYYNPNKITLGSVIPYIYIYACTNNQGSGHCSSSLTHQFLREMSGWTLKY